MPKNIVKNANDEKTWEKAKKIAKRQGSANNWALVVHIFQKIKNKDSDRDLSKVVEKKSVEELKLSRAEQRKAAANALYNRILDIKETLIKNFPTKKPVVVTGGRNKADSVSPTAPLSGSTQAPQPPQPPQPSSSSPSGSNKKINNPLYYPEWKTCAQREFEEGKRDNNIYTNLEQARLRPLITKGFNEREAEHILGLSKNNARDLAKTRITPLSPAMTSLAVDYAKRITSINDSERYSKAISGINPNSYRRYRQTIANATAKELRDEWLKPVKESADFAAASEEDKKDMINKRMLHYNPAQAIGILTAGYAKAKKDRNLFIAKQHEAITGTRDVRFLDDKPEDRSYAAEQAAEGEDIYGEDLRNVGDDFLSGGAGEDEKYLAEGDSPKTISNLLADERIVGSDAEIQRAPYGGHRSSDKLKQNRKNLYSEAAEHTNTSPEDLHNIYTKSKDWPEIQKKIAKNQNIGEKTVNAFLQDLAQKKDQDIYSALAANQGISPGHARQILDSHSDPDVASSEGGIDVLKKLASNTKTSPQDISKIISMHDHNPDSEVVNAAAQNTATDPKDLNKIISKTKPWHPIIEHIAGNTSTDPKDLRDIIDSHDPAEFHKQKDTLPYHDENTIHHIVAANDSINKEDLDYLIGRHPDEETSPVRMQALSNSKLNEDLFNRILDESRPDSNIDNFIANSSEYSPERIQRLIDKYKSPEDKKSKAYEAAKYNLESRNSQLSYGAHGSGKTTYERAKDDIFKKNPHLRTARDYVIGNFLGLINRRIASHIGSYSNLKGINIDAEEDRELLMDAAESGLFQALSRFKAKPDLSEKENSLMLISMVNKTIASTLKSAYSNANPKTPLQRKLEREFKGKVPGQNVNVSGNSAQSMGNIGLLEGAGDDKVNQTGSVFSDPLQEWRLKNPDAARALTEKIKQQNERNAAIMGLNDEQKVKPIANEVDASSKGGGNKTTVVRRRTADSAQEESKQTEGKDILNQLGEEQKNRMGSIDANPSSNRARIRQIVKDTAGGNEMLAAKIFEAMVNMPAEDKMSYLKQLGSMSPDDIAEFIKKQNK